MAIALVESQFGPTSTQNLQFLIFLQFLVRFFFSFFVLLAGNVVLYHCHSIANVLPLYFLIKADLFDLTRQDKKDPGQKDPGQKGTRTKWNQDKREPGQDGSRTRWIQDNREP